LGRLSLIVTAYVIHITGYRCKKCQNVYLTIIVTINDVLRHKAARRNAIVILKCFGTPEDQRPNFDGYIYIHYAATPYSARISSIYLLPFGNIWFGSVC